MSAETKKILEMLAEGKITSEDAEKLLDKLGAGGGAGARTDEAQAGEATPPGHKPRFLRIVVDSPDRDQVNARVPLSFMRTGVRLLAVLPPRVSEKLAAKGFDLSAFAGMKGQDLTEALEELNINVDGPDGKKVRIFCE